jgi:toxin-antitoxin system PIN domain toxin
VPLAFCRTSMQGFLRLVTQAAVMGDAVHTPAEAWHIYAAHLASGRCVLLSEPEGLDLVWQRLSSATGFHTRDWTDAYLASFAIQADCRMVSFDAGFAQYQKVGQNQEAGLDFLHLKPELEAEN